MPPGGWIICGIDEGRPVTEENGGSWFVFEGCTIIEDMPFPAVLMPFEACADDAAAVGCPAAVPASEEGRRDALNFGILLAGACWLTAAGFDGV